MNTDADRGKAQRFDFPILATGHARLIPPANAREQAPLFVLVHGYAQPQTTFEAYARRIAPAEAWILLPEGPSTFHRRRGLPPEERGVARAWIGTLEREPEDVRNSALIHSAIDTALAQTPIDPQRIVIAGYSQGAGVASRAALDRPERFCGLAGLAGGITSPWRDRLGVLNAMKVLWITGTEDASYPPAYIEPLIAAFRAHEVPIRHEALSQGHDLLEAAGPLLAAWLRERLEPSR